MPFLRIFFKKNTLDHPRFAFVIARAVEKRAVRRNLLRRRVREWVRTHLALFSHPVDVIFLFKKEAFTVGRKEIYKELEKALHTIRF